MKREQIYKDIADRREKSNQKFGKKSGHLGLWKENPHLGLTVLMEEVGEVARAALERDEESLRYELVDVAQVVVAWLESYD